MLRTLDISAITQPFLEGFSYFRPLVVFTFFMDALLAGNQPGFSHAVNLALFLANILLVFSVCRRLAENLGSPRASWRAFCAALLYAAHPVMVESTVWISGRFDVLATTFILGATRIYLSRRPGYGRVIGFGLLAFLAMLCKEIGVLLLPAILCLWLALRAAESPLAADDFPRCLRQNARILAAFLVALALYVTLRLMIEEESYVEYMNANGKTGFETAILALEALKFYFHQALFPFASMSQMHPINLLVSPGSASDIIGNLLTLAALAALALYALARRSAAAWLFIAGICYLFLVLHILPIPIGDNLGNERFLTTPLAFWAMAAALVRWEAVFAAAPLQKLAAAMNVFSPRQIALAALAAWFLMLVWTTHTTIPIWQNNLTLWTWSLQQTLDDRYIDDRYVRHSYLNAMCQIGPETAKKAAKYLMDMKGGFLHDDEYLLLVGALLKAGDREALTHLVQIKKQTGPLFDLHQQPDALLKRAALSKRELHKMSSYHAMLAIATFLFHKNPAAALQSNETARWYIEDKKNLKTKGMMAFDFMKTVYLYGLGLFNPARALADSLAARHNYSKAAIYAALKTQLEDYCQADDGEQAPPICDSIFQLPEFRDLETANEGQGTENGRR
jgi:hypothetical protein